MACTCDSFCDDPCPVHARENSLQNECLALRAEADALRADLARVTAELVKAKTKQAISAAADRYVREDALRAQVRDLLKVARAADGFARAIKQGEIQAWHRSALSLAMAIDALPPSALVDPAE